MTEGGLPGMRSGGTGRRVLVATAYVVGWPLLIPVLPFALGVLVGRNYGGWAELVDFLPGIDRHGGARSGLAAFGYGVLVWLVGLGLLALIVVP